jgi:hypothetical protein
MPPCCRFFATGHTFRNCPVWDTIAIQLAIDTINRLDGKISTSEWEKNWELFAGDARLQAPLITFLASSQWSTRTESVIGFLGPYSNKAPMPLAFSMLIRLVTAHVAKKISTEQLIGTLKNRHFRINVADWSMKQFLCCYDLIQYVNRKQIPPERDFETSMKIVLQTMQEQPVDEWGSPLGLITIAEQPPLDRYSLFLQEYAGSHQPFPKFSFSR